MPKPYTDPTLFDNALQLSITKLKEWGYLNSNIIKSGIIKWSSNGIETGCISIKVNTINQQAFIELNYNYFDEPQQHKILLVSVPSNLGKGVVWFFLCPRTNKRCRILYLIGASFLHREAFINCMYESQTHSKSNRLLKKTMQAYFKTDEAFEQLYKKHFKKTYKGKPTKRYLKLMQQIEDSDSINFEVFEKMLLM